MQLREIHAGEKWEGEHIKELGRCERKAERMKSSHKRKQRRTKKDGEQTKAGRGKERYNLVTFN